MGFQVEVTQEVMPLSAPLQPYLSPALHLHTYAYMYTDAYLYMYTDVSLNARNPPDERQKRVECRLSLDADEI